jgi:type IV pilus assembly protein PilV
MGILAVVGLQAASISNANDAKYRSDASLLANELIGQMWVSDRTAATLQANFQSAASGVAAGAAYTAWLNDVYSGLPRASEVPPTVSITPVVGISATSNLVTITIFWKLPSESAGAPFHQYVSLAQII